MAIIKDILFDIPLITNKERNKILYEWNHASKNYDKDKSVIELFELTVLSNPSAIAVIASDKCASYGDINCRANQLARYLQKLGVGRDVMVGSYFERSIDMIVALLAILKAGGAYIPIDPEYPLNRVEHILKDSEVSIVLTQGHLLEGLNDQPVTLLAIDQANNDILGESSDNLNLSIDFNSLVYVIYTSGSTGVPKGVMIEHCSLMNLVNWHSEKYQLSEKYNAALVSGPSFDASVWEIWPNLCSGVTLIIPDEETRLSPSKLVEWLLEEKITISYIPTAYANLYVDYAWPDITSLKYMLTGGDKLHKCPRKNLPFQLVNHYGPTEVTILATASEVIADETRKLTPTIGKPIQNTKVYILDKNYEPVPVGVTGEIFISGIGVARGYLNKPELTDERFLENPFESNCKMYRTGDLGRYTKDGNIEFAGRVDKQIKVRGYRIELEEIETVIGKHSSVLEVAVLARKNDSGENTLYAYLIPSNDSFSINDLRDFIEKYLPDYMMPAHFSTIQKMPINQNGKIDYNALEQLPVMDSKSDEEEYAEPESIVEEMVATVWKKLFKVERIGRFDNFFHLGGHSILASQLVIYINEMFLLDMPIRAVFDKPVLKDMAEAIQELRTEGSGHKESEKASTVKKERIPLSYAQQRLWFLDRLNSASAVYNIPMALQLKGNLRSDYLEASLEQIMKRHETLRYHIIDVEGEPEIIIDEECSPKLVTYHLKSGDGGIKMVEQVMKQEFGWNFDLEKDRLVRFALMKKNESEHILLVTFHHIISDGWSVNVFLNELALLYDGYCKGQEPNLSPLKVQYSDYTIHLREAKQLGQLDGQLRYWEKALRGCESKLELPTDYPLKKEQTFAGGGYSFHIEHELYQALTEFSLSRNVTLYMTLLGAYFTLLYRYSGQDDILVGSPVAGRKDSNTEKMIGFFVNMLVIRCKMNGKLSFTDMLTELRETVLNAFANQDIPFEKIVDKVLVNRSISHSPLFQVSFVLQNATDTSEKSMGDVMLSPMNESDISNVSKYHITLSLEETSNGINGYVEFNTDLFEKQTICRMMKHFVNLLEDIVMEPENQLSTIRMVADDEIKECRLIHYQQPSALKSVAVHKLFEQEVLRNPDRIAVEMDENTISYHDINKKANQLAHYLLSTGVQLGDSVAVCMERSIGLITALLAIVKAGGTYIPIDSKYPKERIDFIVEDTKSTVILTESMHKEKFEAIDYVICYDVEFSEIESMSYDNPGLSIDPEQTAYIIYTSGSTGKPKGVCIPHRAILRVIKETNYLCISEEDIILQAATVSFDAATFEIWGSLCNGAKLVMLHELILLETDKFASIIKNKKITVMFLTTALFNILVDYQPDCFANIRKLLFGGERVSISHARKALQIIGQEKILHVYGPTESTVFATYYPINAIRNCDYTIPIGYPLSETSLYVLGIDLQIQPVGVPGELYIGGKGLAHGYLNRAELTEKSFIANPFVANEKLYKTGDIVKRLPDGAIEFIGRADNQVKIRGFRIELGEIETIVKQYDYIKEAAIVLEEVTDSEKKLIGYVVTDEQYTDEDFYHYMKERLPAYMIPSITIPIDHLPLTANGKLDRKQLPQYNERAVATGLDDKPASELENKLVGIWCDVLNLANVGIHDNFFHLGGDSILSIQLTAKAKTVGIHFSPKQLFECQTIAELSSVVKDSNKNVAEQGIVSGEEMLTPIQTWFAEEQFDNPDHFNQSAVFKVPEDMDATILQKSFEKLLEHHDALRMCFLKKGDSYRQTNKKDSGFKLNRYDYSELSEPEMMHSYEEACEELQESFVLEQGDLIKAALFRFGKIKETKLFITIHHLIIDGVSWRILVEDLAQLYQGFKYNKHMKPVEKTTSYLAWSKKLQEYACSEQLLREADYWRKIKNDRIQGLPVDYPDGKNMEGSTVAVSGSLSVNETKLLLTKVLKAYHAQINDILLSALVITMSNWTGQESLLIHLEGHGREEIDEEIDLTRTIGWFTSIYPVLFDKGGKSEVESIVKEVKHKLREIPKKGIGYGILKYMNPDISFENEPKAEISFNYLGQFDQIEAQSDELFRMDEETGGRQIGMANRRSHLLDITGSVINQEMRFTWMFSDDVMRPQTIQLVSSLYLQVLRGLIDKVSDINEKNFISHFDYPYSNIKDNQLKSLLDQYPDMEDIYVLSPLQQGLLYQWKYDRNNGDYVIQFVLSIEGELNVAAWETAWQRIIHRYTILRTSFVWEELEEPHQIVHSDDQIDLKELFYFKMTEKKQRSQMERYLLEDRKRGFDLNKVPMRHTLIKTEKDRYYFIFSVHHILIDGWSVSLIWNDVFQEYKLILKNDKNQSYVKPFIEYIKWIDKQDKEAAGRFWQEKLEGFNSITELPYRVRHETDVEKVYKEIEISLQHKTSDRLQEWAKKHQVTLNTVLQGAWALLLSRYSGKKDVMFGTVVSGRPASIDHVDQMAGLFINTIPGRVVINENDYLVEWLQDLQKQQLIMREFEYSSLTQLQEWSEIPSGSPLFDSLYVFENYPVGEEEEDDYSLKINQMMGKEQTNYPIVLMGIPGEVLSIRLVYEEHMFRKEGMERTLHQLEQLLANISISTNQQITDISMMDNEEKLKILSWTDTSTNYPKNRSVIWLFEQQVKQNPQNIAVVFENVEYTYEELDKKADIVANYLYGQGVGVESKVCILMKRSVNMIIAMVGILKAGAAYVPIDPEYPAERIQYMINDVKSDMILTEDSRDVSMMEHMVQLVDGNFYREHKLSDGDSRKLCPITSPDHLAYVIYTSGSTGVPKGSCITNRGIVRLIRDTNYLTITQDDVLLQASSVSFDAATFEIWGSLCNGAKLVLVSRNAPSLKEITDMVQSHKVTILWLTSGLFNIIAEFNLEGLKGVKNLLVGGDVVSGSHVKKVMQLEGIKVINGYGPTENTTFTCCHEIKESDLENSTVPIGKPISNTSVYILDDYMKLVPTEVVGELYIGGDGLARGYLNDTKLTSEKFVKNPFNSNERLYKSGDLACWNDDGTVEFRGRADKQVKINGYRIELGEIERRLLEHGCIKQTVVMVEKKDDINELIAYVITEPNMSGHDISDYLKMVLPCYMIPHKIINVTFIPLTANGKVDYKKISEFNVEGEGEKERILPETETQKVIYDLWKEVLDYEDVSITDNFFEVGGHSLKSMKLVTKLEHAFQINIPLIQFHKDPTILGLSSFLEHSKDAGQVRSNKNLVLIRSMKNSNNKNLFVLHGGNGEVYANINFINALDFKANYWGIRYEGFHELSDQPLEITKLASQYIGVIREVQPKGPYNLMGWSFGGTMVYEIARQLEECGEKITFLSIFDSLAPKAEYEGKIERFTVETEIAFVKSMLSPASHLLDDINLANTDVTGFWKQLIEAMRESDDCDIILRQIKKEQNIKLFLSDSEDISFEDIVKYINRSRILGIARDQYEPTCKVAAQAYFLKASENSQIKEKDWNKYFEKDVIIYELGGDHDSIFKEENIKSNSKIYDGILKMLFGN